MATDQHGLLRSAALEQTFLQGFGNRRQTWTLTAVAPGGHGTVLRTS